MNHMFLHRSNSCFAFMHNTKLILTFSTSSLIQTLILVKTVTPSSSRFIIIS